MVLELSIHAGLPRRLIKTNNINKEIPMSFRSAVSSAWRAVSRDAAVIVGVIQVIIACSDLTTRYLNRRKQQRPGLEVIDGEK